MMAASRAAARARIDDEHVALLFQAVQHGGEALVHEQLGRVGRDLAGGDDGQAGQGGLAHDSSSVALPVTKSDTPPVRGRPNSLWMWPLRMSASTTMTRCRLRQHRAQVLGDEALAHVRRGPVMSRGAVCAQQREVQVVRRLRRLSTALSSGWLVASSSPEPLPRLTRQSARFGALSGTVAYTAATAAFDNVGVFHHHAARG